MTRKRTAEQLAQHAKYMRDRWAANRDVLRARQREYYHSNIQKQREWSRRTREKNANAIKARKKSYYEENKEDINKRGYQMKIATEEGRERRKYNSAKYAAKAKEEMVVAYGGKCECCGEDRIEFLTIDHIHGRGSDERRIFGVHTYRRLRKLGYPRDNYRLLCMNCNFSLGRRDYCPHQKERQMALAVLAAD